MVKGIRIDLWLCTFILGVSSSYICKLVISTCGCAYFHTCALEDVHTSLHTMSQHCAETKFREDTRN